LAEIESIACSPSYVTRYIRLRDCFGDNGVISVAIGRVESTALHLELWLMSCRVLKRDVELLMLDQLVAAARNAGATALRGYFFRTPKNEMVSRLYESLGFTFASGVEDRSEWTLSLAHYLPRNVHIRLADPLRTES
jgi:FkbH-like protein